MADHRLIRLAYLSGPVDAVDVFERWKAAKHTRLFGTSYLMQFFDLCNDFGAEALVITTLPEERSRTQVENITIENRPPPKLSGMFYHLQIAWTILAIFPSLARFKPDAIVITAYQNYWFLLFYAKLLGIEIIPSAHCVMWRPFGKNPRHWRILHWLDGLFLRTCVNRAMAISDVVAQQLRQMAQRRDFEVATIVPTYLRGHFDNILPVDHTRRPFTVLFNGRVEANKGVLDVLEIAARLRRERPEEFKFEICGDGAELQEVRRQVKERSLEDTVNVNGFCEKNQLTSILDSSHVVIVPTRSDFEEGLAKTCVEAVLSGRPFITSPVCPALNSLGSAGVGVPPDDVREYGDAILTLADNRDLFQSKVEASIPLREQFYDLSRSYKEVLKHHLHEAGIRKASS